MNQFSMFNFNLCPASAKFVNVNWTEDNKGSKGGLQATNIQMDLIYSNKCPNIRTSVITIITLYTSILFSQVQTCNVECWFLCWAMLNVVFWHAPNPPKIIGSQEGRHCMFSIRANLVPKFISIKWTWVRGWLDNRTCSYVFLEIP